LDDKRIKDTMRILIASAYWMLGALGIVVGVVLIFRGFSTMADGNLPTEIATLVLLRIILGFCLLWFGYRVGGKGKARMKTST
jgi:hypothetical protein